VIIIRANVRRGTLGGPALANAIGEGISRGLAIFERHLKTVTLRGSRPAAGLFKRGGRGSTLAVGTGSARASIAQSTFRVGNRFVGVIGSPLPYVALHEYGTRDRPITGKPWIKIPTVFYDRYQNSPGFFQTTKKGNLFFFTKAGARQRVVRVRGEKRSRAVEASGLIPVFMLKRSVKFRPRGMFRATEAATRGAITRVMRDTILRAAA
jgi:hypothetical protein